MTKFIVNKDDEGQTVLKFLKKNFKKVPVSLIHKIIRTKKVTVNDTKVKEGHILINGDLINVGIDQSNVSNKADKINEMLHYTPSFNLSVAYEDEDILVANKQSGITIHEGEDNLDNAVIRYLNDKQTLLNNQTFIPTHVHRIDKETSGLVIYAKNKESHENLSNQFKERSSSLRKYYVAIVQGKFNQQSKINTGYITELKNKMQFSSKKIDETSKECTTLINLVRYDKVNNQSILECELQTGRKHQIRATLSYLNHPIVGDNKYGSNIKTTMRLCSHKIKINGKEIRIDPPWKI
jgi:23S rRNA pseudouridine955/2504/2580 synthase